MQPVATQRLSRGSRPRFNVSFEFFPPNTTEMEATLWDSVSRLAPLNPHFVSVTYGAGGKTRERTHAVLERIITETPIRPAAHLTCVAASRDEVDAVAKDYWRTGVRHIVALRGDPHSGPGTPYEAHPDGYQTSTELVAGLKKIGDFEISVSAYPEGHPEGSVDGDIEHLKAKVGAGASRAITQFFFDNEIYLRYLDKVRARGITIPIVPGIVPVQNFKQVAKFAKGTGALGAVLACGPIRRARRRSRDASARRRDSGGRAGARSRRPRGLQLPLLHDESRRPRLCHLPPARHASGVPPTESRLMTDLSRDDLARKGAEVRAALKAAAAERILVLDGAMGTMIQGHKLHRGGVSRRTLCRLGAATCGATTTCWC